MRSREKIESAFMDCHWDRPEHHLILEVLLDIRDLMCRAEAETNQVQNEPTEENDIELAIRRFRSKRGYQPT